MNISDLERNDPEAAARVYRERVLAGTWTPDDAEMIVMLQDDPARLLELIADVNREPGFLNRLNAVLARDD